MINQNADHYEDNEYVVKNMKEEDERLDLLKDIRKK